MTDPGAGLRVCSTWQLQDASHAGAILEGTVPENHAGSCSRVRREIVCTLQAGGAIVLTVVHTTGPNTASGSKCRTLDGKRTTGSSRRPNPSWRPVSRLQHYHAGREFPYCRSGVCTGVEPLLLDLRQLPLARKCIKYLDKIQRGAQCLTEISRFMTDAGVPVCLPFHSGTATV